MYLFYFFIVLLSTACWSLNSFSVDLATDTLVRATHVLLPVHGHLGEYVLLKLFVTVWARSATVCRLQTVGCVRLNCAGSAGCFCLPPVFIAAGISFHTLHAHHLHLVVRAGCQSARLRIWEVRVAPLRACRWWLIQMMVCRLVGHQRLIGSCIRAFTVHDVTLLDVSKDTKASLRWDQTAHYFLCHIFGWGAQQVFQLDWAEFLNYRRLFLNRILEAWLKFVQLSLFLVEILDQSSTSLLHLIKSTLETDPVWCLIALSVLYFVIGNRILRVPDVVSNELFNLVLPGSFQIVVLYILDLVHKALNILNEDIVSRNEDALLGPAGPRRTWLATRIDRRLHRGLGLWLGRSPPSSCHTLFNSGHWVSWGLACIHDLWLGGIGVLSRASDRSALLRFFDNFLFFFFLKSRLVLLLFLVLLVRAQRHVHLHFDFRSASWGDGRSEDLICEEHLV